MARACGTSTFDDAINCGKLRRRLHEGEFHCAIWASMQVSAGSGNIGCVEGFLVNIYSKLGVTLFRSSLFMLVLKLLA